MSTYKLTIKEPNARVTALLDLIRAIDEMELSEEESLIPQWQQVEVQKRKQNLVDYPESALDFDIMMAEFKEKYGL